MLESLWHRLTKGSKKSILVLRLPLKYDKAQDLGYTAIIDCSATSQYKGARFLFLLTKHCLTALLIG